MNTKGGSMMIGILMLVFTILTLVAVLPAFKSTFNLARQSNSMNCPGYTHPTNPVLSYNSSLATETIACTGIDLGIPLIVLGILIGGIVAIISGRSETLTDGGVI
jgi:hypothetical protein